MSKKTKQVALTQFPGFSLVEHEPPSGWTESQFPEFNPDNQVVIRIQQPGCWVSWRKRKAHPIKDCEACKAWRNANYNHASRAAATAGRCTSAPQVYRPNGRILPLPKPKFGRGDGRVGDRPAVAPSGWRETAVPMRGHRHHSRIGRAKALTGRHARPGCTSSGHRQAQWRGFSNLHQNHAWPAHLFSWPTV